jgi:hypothetical protein
MTITINRNLLLFVLALVALGVIGYVIGSGLTQPQQASPGQQPVGAVTATLPPELAAQAQNPQVAVPTTAPDTAPRIEVDEYKTVYDQGNPDTILVDVRTADSFAQGHITGAVSIPELEMANRLAELPKDKHIVLYCA